MKQFIKVANIIGWVIIVTAPLSLIVAAIIIGIATAPVA